ncbi:uncharacterized protein [Musca autumnalis]|uniref:uncharacterized protein n=1 Tax=Musca autumnalis TaxID=221902 RepID=UPI003CF52847
MDNSNNISSSQHAYIKGRSTDTALHEVVRTIEKSLEHKQYTLAAFLDIEGAFNNVSTTAIKQALDNFGLESFISSWITTMLQSRVITASLGNSTLSKHFEKNAITIRSFTTFMIDLYRFLDFLLKDLISLLLTTN